MSEAHIVQIIPHLYLGDRYSVISREDYLTQNNIQVVISALTEEEYADYIIGPEDFGSMSQVQANAQPGLREYFGDNITWHRLVLDDDPTEPIHTLFPRTNNIITEALAANKNVLVHCSAGISRSVTLVAAYLVNAGHVRTPAEAVSLIQRRRPYASPNNGFWKALVAATPP